MMSLLLSVSSRSSLRTSLRGSLPSVVINQPAPEAAPARHFYSWEATGDVVLTGGAEIVSRVLRSSSNITITTGAEKLNSAIRDSVSPTITTGALRVRHTIYEAVVLGGVSENRNTKMVIAFPLPMLSHRKAESVLVAGPQSHTSHLAALAELNLNHWIVTQPIDAGEIKALEFTPIDPAVTGFKAIVVAGHSGANTASPDNPNTNWLYGGCSINVSGGYLDFTAPNPFADGEFSGYWLSLSQDNASYSIDKVSAIESPETLWLFAERNDGQVFPLYAFGALWDADSEDPQDSSPGTAPPGRRLFGMMSCTPDSTNIEAANQWLSHRNSANRAHAGCFTSNGFEAVEHHGRRNNASDVGGNIRRSGKTLLMPHFYDYTDNGQHFAGVLREVGYTRHCQAHQAMTDGQVPPSIQMVLMSESSITDRAGYGFHVAAPTIVTT